MRALMVAVVAFLCACPPGQITRCENDAQCNPLGGTYFTCDVATGACLCNDDRGCEKDAEFCNGAGRCQALSGCVSNDECPGEGLFCDVVHGACIAKEQCDPADGEICCVLDGQCPFGMVCAAIEGKCLPGCRDDGDCKLGDGCVGGGPLAIGQCDPDACTADYLCNPGEICNLAEGACVPDTRGPYCDPCSNDGSDECDGWANYCLVEQTDPTGQSYFCGVDCAQGQPCPNGYACVDVIIIPPTEQCGREICQIPEGANTGNCTTSTEVVCAVDDDCPFGGPGGTCSRAHTGNCLNDVLTPCDTDGECCADGADCPEGSCVKQFCVGGENAAIGYCTCTRDADCFVDRCLDADLTDPNTPVKGHCELSGHDCFADIDCDTIACINGGCLLGSNCAPSNDRSCNDLASP